MSEEEKLINYFNSIDITRIFYDNPPHDNHVGIGKAIQGLLDLYNKEKEKNKELENQLNQMYNKQQIYDLDEINRSHISFN